MEAATETTYFIKPVCPQFRLAIKDGRRLAVNIDHMIVNINAIFSTNVRSQVFTVALRK